MFNFIGAIHGVTFLSNSMEGYNSSKPHIISIDRPTYTGGAPVLCVHSFQLATPAGFNVNHIPKGNLVIMKGNCGKKNKLRRISGDTPES